MKVNIKPFDGQHCETTATGTLLRQIGIELSRQKIEEAGLSEFVEFRVGDAIKSISNATETFDFVLVDVWKELYLPCFDLFFPKLKKGAWVLADNMIFPPHAVPEATIYRNRVRETQAFDTVLLPIGSGIEVSLLK
jgi:predicted O-methyltransferase YrrM